MSALAKMAGASRSKAARGRPGSFVDSARVSVRAGHGGRGSASFRHEPFVPHGGPDGGDGGRGGSIILYADPQLASLRDYITRQSFSAEDGKAGAKSRKLGRGGEDVRLPVPVGTAVYDDAAGTLLADLDQPGATSVVARGGAGGRGNMHFKSSVNQAPDYAEPGKAGEERELRLELRLIADVGLVGPPNAGKSSLLAALSAARPKIGDYPFTTLDPELGVSNAGGERFVVADIPGLIQGAADGAGLGLQFLRHLERTRLLVFVIDGASDNPFGDLETVRREVRLYSRDLARRGSLVVVNKVDLTAARELRRRSRRSDVVWVSARTGEGIPELRAAVQAALVAAPRAVRPEPEAVVELRPRRGRRAEPPIVQRRPWGLEVTGAVVDRLLEKVDFESSRSFDWFQVQLDRRGITAALEEAGVQPGDTVRLGDVEFEYQP
jgi:GTPase